MDGWMDGRMARREGDSNECGEKQLTCFGCVFWERDSNRLLPTRRTGQVRMRLSTSLVDSSAHIQQHYDGLRAKVGGQVVPPPPKGIRYIKGGEEREKLKKKKKKKRKKERVKVGAALLVFSFYLIFFFFSTWNFGGDEERDWRVWELQGAPTFIFSREEIRETENSNTHTRKRRLKREKITRNLKSALFFIYVFVFSLFHSYWLLGVGHATFSPY